MRSETNWYRCTTRDEMIKLVVAGFDYTNFRKDRFNDGNITYYFERTKELENYLASTARVQKKGCYMKNELEIFKNEDFGEIRTLLINDKPYFCASDIAKILGYSNTRDAISRHCKGVVKSDIPTNS